MKRLLKYSWPWLLLVIFILVVWAIGPSAPLITKASAEVDPFIKIGSPDGYRVDVFMFQKASGAVVYTCFLAVTPSMATMACP